MPARTRFILAVAVLGLLMTGPFLLTAVLIWLESPTGGRDMLIQAVAPHLPLGALITVFGFALGVLVVRNLFRQYVQGVERLGEQLRLMLDANRDLRVEPSGPPEVCAVVGVVNELARQRDEMMADVDARIERAKSRVEEEKNRLAALMSELTQSVVVCNLDGRILLYNSRARAQFRALSETPGVAGGGELIGLGRSIYAVFERNRIAHALETIRQRLLRPGGQAVANFVTTLRGGQLIRVRMSPVLSGGEEQDGGEEGGKGEREITGFILLLDNITRDFESESRRDEMIHLLTEGNRASLANVRAAAEMLDYPDLQDELRKRFRKVIRDEVQALSARLDRAAAEFADTLKSRWPLEDMLGADLISAVRGRIEAVLGLPTKVEEVDENLWMRVDSFSLLQALAYLVSRLADEFEVREVRFRLTGSGRLVHLDLIWSGQAMSTETVMTWELEPMRFAGENSPLAVRDVIDRHGGEMWLEREKVRHRAFFRILLPAAVPQAPPDTGDRQHAGRPEYYDFDLFSWSERAHGLDDCLLTELAYTVFDTETTGLNPSEGDEIVQIGATRVLNGKLLRQESFEQLVDPCRPMPRQAVDITGITPEMLRGQPVIAKVLPAFHAFSADTVLVAHNAAFDMRFLQLKEAATGLVFDQPVLDTLLLSAVVHPGQESHSLDAIVQRFGLKNEGRHTALADAVVTAEVLIKLIPLLAEHGIRTLREAREAAEKTYYARLKY